MKFSKLNLINNMMANLVSEGHHAVWQEMEKEPNALKRIHLRKVFTQAQLKLKKGK